MKNGRGRMQEYEQEYHYGRVKPYQKMNAHAHGALFLRITPLDHQEGDINRVSQGVINHRQKLLEMFEAQTNYFEFLGFTV